MDPPGRFRMGSDRHYPDEAPEREVYVDGFFIDRCAVTNGEFAHFVEQTGYVTLRGAPDRRCRSTPARYPSFWSPARPFSRSPPNARGGELALVVGTTFLGASWRYPEGPGSTIIGLAEHPVVHMTYEDAEGVRLVRRQGAPTEAEWEHAARGGLEGAEFAWGTTRCLEEGR